MTGGFSGQVVKSLVKSGPANPRELAIFGLKTLRFRPGRSALVRVACDFLEPSSRKILRWQGTKPEPNRF